MSACYIQMLFELRNEISEIIERLSNRWRPATILESNTEFVCKLLREFGPNVLKICSKLHFNGQGGASNDDMDGSVPMAWTGASVYD